MFSAELMTFKELVTAADQQTAYDFYAGKTVRCGTVWVKYSDGLPIGACATTGLGGMQRIVRPLSVWGDATEEDCILACNGLLGNSWKWVVPGEVLRGEKWFDGAVAGSGKTF